MFYQRVSKYIKEKALLSDKEGGVVLVALSGGADSVALLRVLVALGYSCEAAHCNFHLRGAESDRDEAFVRRLCREQDVRLHVIHFDTLDYAARRQISVEMAARELRYGWFEQLRVSCAAQAVAVAHHRDDSVETFLLNLIRGTGINGLKGISSCNGYVVRPLLAETRQSILDFLAVLGQDYVTDSTNLQDEYMRNKIRLRVLPLLAELNPSVADSIAATATRLGDVALIYNKVMKEAAKRVWADRGAEEGQIDIAALQAEEAPRSLLFELLHPLGFNARQVEDVFVSLSDEPGKYFRSASHEVLRDRKFLLVRPLQGKQADPPCLRTEVVERTPEFAVVRDRCVACLDADKVCLPLEVRKWQAGDKFVPFGMTGMKKVSDYLKDRKYSLFDKESQYVACSGGKIVWIIGERIDNRFRVTDETKRILIVSRYSIII